MILFFDTETNNKPTDYKAPMDLIDNWPRLLELAFQLYTDAGELVTEQSMIIKPAGWEEISPEASEIHGITLDVARTVGVPINYALNCFRNTKRLATKTVAYNLRFDQSVINCEFIRAGVKNFDWVGAHCAMMEATELMKLPGPSWAKGYKWPSLQEFYSYTVEKEIEDAHAALGDVKALAEAYFFIN